MHSGLFLFAFSDNLISEDWFFAEGAATALAEEGGVGDVVWLIQALLEIRHATALTTGAKHWHR